MGDIKEIVMTAPATTRTSPRRQRAWAVTAAAAGVAAAALLGLNTCQHTNAAPDDAHQAATVRAYTRSAWSACPELARNVAGSRPDTLVGTGGITPDRYPATFDAITDRWAELRCEDYLPGKGPR